LVQVHDVHFVIAIHTRDTAVFKQTKSLVVVVFTNGVAKANHGVLRVVGKHSLQSLVRAVDI
jgi:hypothetical protein